MNIFSYTVPHTRQRYNTVGDWGFSQQFDSLHITVSELSNEDYEFLICLHEIIEAYLCRKDGVAEDAVTEFDKKHLAERRSGEPGDDPRAPYHRQHAFASQIERYIANALGVNWDDYADAIDALSQEPK